jgi:hypothetical protein
MTETVLPYLGTEGYVTRQASILRAQRDVISGNAGERQIAILKHLSVLPQGATWVEVGHALQLHHGQVSGALSVLHKAGKLFQLRDTRSRSHPYVHSNFRYKYTDSERFDTPTRTNGKLLKARIDDGLVHAEAALHYLNELSLTTEVLLVREQLSALLACLNGEKDEG